MIPGSQSERADNAYQGKPLKAPLGPNHQESGRT